MLALHCVGSDRAFATHLYMFRIPPSFPLPRLPSSLRLGRRHTYVGLQRSSVALIAAISTGVRGVTGDGGEWNGCDLPRRQGYANAAHSVFRRGRGMEKVASPRRESACYGRGASPGPKRGADDTQVADRSSMQRLIQRLPCGPAQLRRGCGQHSTVHVERERRCSNPGKPARRRIDGFSAVKKGPPPKRVLVTAINGRRPLALNFSRR